MKKMVLVVVGIVLLIGAVVLINRERTQGTQEEAIGITNVSQVIESATNNLRLPRADESRRAGGGTAQGLQDAGGTVASDGGVASTRKELSGAVKALIGQDGKKHNYPSLLKAINALDQEMSATDVAALREMLNFSNDQFPEKMRSIEINAVKNDVLDKLLRQKDLPEGLGLQMVEMAGNAETDPVWRDYCIQFCPIAWERIDAEFRISNRESRMSKEAGERLATKSAKGAEARIAVNSKSSSVAGGENEELLAIHDAMFSALDERDATLAGTSLIGLELLSRTHDEFDREVIVGKAVEIAGDEMASAASRLTALRLSAGISNDEQGMSREAIISEGNSDEGAVHVEVVKAARSLAQTGETVLLRSAAIVTLGEVGTADDRELLVSYVRGENRQIAASAKMALAKMDARSGDRDLTK